MAISRSSSLAALISIGVVAGALVAGDADAAHLSRQARHARNAVLRHARSRAADMTVRQAIAPSPKTGVGIPSGIDQISPEADMIERVVEAPSLTSIYGGDIVHPDGAVTVYVTTAGKSQMQATLQNALPATAAGSYTLVEVAHTYAALEALTQKIAQDTSFQSGLGATLVTWGPDVANNVVRIQVSGYTPLVAQELQSHYGSDWVSVIPYSEQGLPQRTQDRYYDEPAFWDGDRVFMENNTSNKCTDAFEVRGNLSGNNFNTTAGHCGGSSIWTNFTKRYKIGNVSTNYFNANKNKDIESFPCNCFPFVYYNGSSYHEVTGICGTCGQGQLVTMDGATSQEVPDVTVIETGICVNFPDGRTCNLNGAVKSTNQGYVPSCTGGGSGGPVYQRASNNRAFAAGVIVGVDAPGLECYYHTINDVLTWMNSALVIVG